MANRTSLCLQVFEDGNCDILRVMDCSYIHEDLDITSFTLDITIPDFEEPVTINVEEGFNLPLTSEDLGLTSEDEDLSSLSDGIYVIKLNITGEEVACDDLDEYVEYNYLRQCKAYCLLNKKRCALQLDTCDSCNKSKEGYFKAILEIEMFLKAAKAYVEECNAPEKGKALNDYAIGLLEKLDLDCTNCK